MNNIITFVIGTKKGKDSIWDTLGVSDEFIKKAHVTPLDSISDFKTIYNLFEAGTEFRLLIHPNLKSNFDKNDLSRIESSVNSLKRVMGNSETLKFQFITRSSQVKTMCESRKKYFISPSKNNFEFCYASFVEGEVGISGDNTKVEDFISQLIIYEKFEHEGFQLENNNDANQNSRKIKTENLTTEKSISLEEKSKIVILSALSEELIPFRQVLSIEKKIGYDQVDFDDKKIKMYSQHEMGMVDAAIFTSKVINETNPEVIIMPGVCGGRKSEKVKLYDIIIPKKSLDIITGQYMDKKFIPYGYDAKPEKEFFQYIEGIVNDRNFILKEMYNLIPNEKEYKRKNHIIKDLTIHLDVMGCGPFVLKTDKFLDEKAKEMNHKLKGFEMESYGVLRTCELINKEGVSLIVKSVMDYTDSKKADVSEFSDAITDDKISEQAISEVPEGENIKEMAAYFSALCVRALLPHIYKYIAIKSS